MKLVNESGQIRSATKNPDGSITMQEPPSRFFPGGRTVRLHADILTAKSSPGELWLEEDGVNEWIVMHK